MFKKAYLINFLIFSLTVILCNYGSIATAKENVQVRVAVGGSKSSSMGWSVAMGQLCQKYSDYIKIDSFPTKGYPESLHFLLSERADMGVASELSLPRARQGIGEFKSLGERTDMRILMNAAIASMQAVVLEKSDITALSAEQLKGKTIATRQAGSISGAMTLAYLKILGIDRRKDVKMLYLSATDACNAVIDGTADIFMCISGVPTTAIRELAETKSTRFIPIPKELTDKVGGLVHGFVPAGSYKGQDKPIETANMIPYFLVKENFDPDVAYEIVKLWWTHIDERNQVHPTIKRFSTVEVLQNSLENAKSPIHEGALRYYREKGWVK